MTNLEKLDTLPALQKALEQEREARKRAERELTAWRAETGAGLPEDAGAAIRNTREDLRQAEKEREETLRMWRDYKAIKDADVASADAARERAEAEVIRLRQQREEDARTVRAALDAQAAAEADNAALLDGLRTAHDPHAFNTCHGTDCACGVVVLLDAAHPGSVLLERVRALEELRDEVVNVQGQDRLGEDETTEAIMSFVRAADALKGKS